jgi:hypothetical protein
MIARAGELRKGEKSAKICSENARFGGNLLAAPCRK